MIRMKRIAVVVWATIVASLGVVIAEEPAAPAARPWKDSADFGLVLTTGNTENFNVALTNKFVYTWSNAEFTLDAAALRTENTTRTLANDTAANTVVVTETDTTTAEMYAVGGKYTHKILENFFWYVNAGWVSNKPSGIDNRYAAGGGLGYRFFKTEVQTLSMEFGVDYTKEEQTTGFNDSFAGARLFLGYLYNISKTSSFTEDLTLLENLDDTDDFRGRSVSALTASLSQKMALKVSLTLLYDNQPVVVDVQPVAPATAAAQFEFDKLDTILTAALVVNF
jgi:putative salt-induced outer membrane protein YdiY